MEIVSCVVFEEILVQSGRKHFFFFGLFFLHLGMKFNFTDVIAARVERQGKVHIVSNG